MKYLLEFAKFRDVAKTRDTVINNIINQSFKNDERLIVVVPFKNNKDILIKWHDTKDHPIIERVKKRTSFKSTSEFNEFIKKVIYNLFDNHFEEMDKSGKYGLYFKENTTTDIVDYEDKFYFSLNNGDYTKPIV